MTTAERLRSYWAERELSGDRLAAVIARYWVIALIGALMVTALVLRLWGLDVRAVHHDESIHMKWAWDFSRTGEYTHSPTYHGPFHYLVGGALFWILRVDNEFTARLLPALLGTGLVAIPFFLRRYIGWTGAFIAAGLLAISPVLLYFSRFARNDIYIAFFTLGMAVLIWRYLKEQREPYLFGIAGFLMLGFITKEVAWITTAVFIVYLEIQLATDLIDQMRASRPMTFGRVALAYAVLIPTGWLLVAFWPLLGEQRKRWSLSTMPPAGHLVVLIGTFTLPQFAAAVQKIPEFVGKVPAIGDGLVTGLHLEALQDDQAIPCQEENQCSFALVEGEQWLRFISVFGLILATGVVGTLWNKRVWLLSAVIFYVPYFLLYTTFFQNGGDIWNPFAIWTGDAGSTEFWRAEGGFWSGIWGSLDYWMLQQFVARGSQPDYYYFIITPVYEFLPLIFALGGVFVAAFRGELERKMLAMSGLLLILAFSLTPGDAPIIGAVHIHLAFIIALGLILMLISDSLLKFLAFWTLATLYALTIAGEKMPWLSAHVALPLALMAAKVLSDILEPAVDRVKATFDGTGGTGDERTPVPLHVALLAGGATLGLGSGLTFLLAGPASPLSVLAWMLAAGALGTVLWPVSAGSLRVAGQVAAVALLAAVLPFTSLTAGRAAFDQGDPQGTPPEILIYAQGSPGLSVVYERIQEQAERTGQGTAMPIVVDNSNGANIWPWPWYLRDYPASYQAIDENFVPQPGSVVLATIDGRATVERYSDQVTDRYDYVHMWWFPEAYRGLESPTAFVGDTLRGEYWGTWAGFFIDRDMSFAVGPSIDRFAYFFGEFDPETIRPPVEGTVADDQQTVIGEPGSGAGQLSQPADVAVDAEGNIYVVDTLNHRVQKFSPDGAFLAQVGSEGRGEGEFSNPASDDENLAPDGPWGIAVDSEGNVYVADTWYRDDEGACCGRIQKFNADLEFVDAWRGEGLFGPRDIAIGPNGNLLVADTGNSRIVEFTRDGELVQTHGGPGTGQGQFQEPTSIYVTEEGDIYVADFWNNRIQRFDSQMSYVGEVAAPSWPIQGATGVTDRAYIAALADGRILATDPISGEVLTFNAAGEWEAAWRLRPSDMPMRPIGITIDAEQRVYVVDSLNSVVRRFPAAALSAPETGTATPTAVP